MPIIPTAIVGSEEIYPLIARVPALARMLGLPYFPITPLFPWLGPLGMIPLPSKWIIEFGEAITTDELGSGAADDPMIVFNITDQVRETIQQTLYALLMQRRSAFFLAASIGDVESRHGIAAQLICASCSGPWR